MCLTGVMTLIIINDKAKVISDLPGFLSPYMASFPAFLSCRGGTSVFRKSDDAVGGGQWMIDVINVQS